MAPHLPPVDGIRAIASLSLVALHATIVTSALLPSRGPEWNAFATHPLYGLFQGGGCQVDVFFLLSGFLLGSKHVSLAPSDATLGTLARDTLRRACRLWPTLLAVAFVQLFVLGEEHSDHVPALQVLAFVNNLHDVRARGTFTLTVAWSVCVDFQVGACLSLLLFALRRAFPAEDARRYRLAAKASLLIAFLASFAVRFALQDPRRYSIVRLGEHTHFTDALTAGSRDWLRDRYHLDLDVHAPRPNAAGVESVNAAAEYAHEYLNRLYMPTWARYGPLALGALLAFVTGGAESLAAALEETKASSERAKIPRASPGRVARECLAWTAASGFVATAMIPPPPPGEADGVPLEAHVFMTVALRNLFALAVAFALYAATAPPGKFASSPRLRRWLSRPAFAFVAKHSFALNMFHFRALMELAYLSPRVLGPFALASVVRRARDAGTEAMGAPPGMFAAAALWVVGAAASLGLAKAFDDVAEGPLRRGLERGLLGWTRGKKKRA